MKNGKSFVMGVIALCMLVFMGCASGPRIYDVPVYVMEQMAPADTLTGSNVVVFDLAMGERVLPSRATGSSGGFLANAAILRSYNNLATSNTILSLSDEVLAERQAVFNQIYFANFSELFGGSAASASFSFGSDTPSFNVFRNPTEAIRYQINQAAAQNNADFVIAMVGQMVSADTMNAPTDTAPSTINLEVYLFNRNGDLVALGTSTTLIVGIHHREALFRERYAAILDDAFENINLMLAALGGNGPVSATKLFEQ